MMSEAAARMPAVASAMMVFVFMTVSFVTGTDVDLRLLAYLTLVKFFLGPLDSLAEPGLQQRMRLREVEVRLVYRPALLCLRERVKRHQSISSAERAHFKRASPSSVTTTEK